MSNAQSARMYVVHGRVQGVGFRYFVQRVARELALAGYVKNRADSTVEVYAMGALGVLDRLEQKLRAGPSFSRVDHVERREAEHEPVSGFRIEY